ncbi:MAG: FAD synthetase family protein [Rikenellaceae bacterium]
MITHLYKLSQPIKSALIATIGSYDGVHVGHRTILHRMITIAKEQHLETAVITFDPHPRLFIEGKNSNLKILSTIEEKKHLLSEIGIDHLIILKFDKELQQLTADQFSKQILTSYLGVRQLMVGYNNHIGSDKQLSMNFLKENTNIKSIVIPKIDIDNDKISSTLIREEILSGEMAKAAVHLGNPYTFICHVNYDGSIETPNDNKLIPKDGTYIGKIDSLETKITVHHNKLEITRLLPCSLDLNTLHLLEICK